MIAHHDPVARRSVLGPVNVVGIARVGFLRNAEAAQAPLLHHRLQGHRPGAEHFAHYVVGLPVGGLRRLDDSVENNGVSLDLFGRKLHDVFIRITRTIRVGIQLVGPHQRKLP